MKRLGLFLGYSPNQMDPHQGISRLVAFIIKGAIASDNTAVTVAAPSWLKEDIQLLLSDAGIPEHSIELVTTRGEPYLSRIQRWYLRRARRKPKARYPFLRQLRKWISAGTIAAVDFLSTPSTFVFTVGLISAIALGAVLAVPLLLLAMVGIVVVATRGIKRRFSRSRYAVVGKRLINRIWRVVLGVGAYDRLRENEIGRLVRKLNRRKDIGVWYVPSVFWPEVGSLKGKVVIAAPDIVFYEHPSQFNDAGSRRVIGRISRSLNVADHIICYSEYVKQKHYVERHKIQPERISVIPHGQIDLTAIQKSPKDRIEALDIVHKYTQNSISGVSEYLKGFRFDDVEFIFYSSQDRPHKNIEGLVEVYSRLLRERYRPVKLILTARMHENPRIMRLLGDRGLERDVLTLHSVPNIVLSALYRLARLSVTPTQFEGGFPFTFSEAYSVGTPSVMSRIPVVRELLQEQNILDMMTFDPQDREGMLEKIEWGLDNTDELFAAQALLYKKFQERPWNIVAEEYISLLRRVEFR